MIQFLLVLILTGGFFIFRTLKKLLEEVKIVRAFIELPSDAKRPYDEQMNEIDAKIETAFALMLVTPKGEAEDARKMEFKELANSRQELREQYRKHFFIRSEYLK